MVGRLLHGRICIKTIDRCLYSGLLGLDVKVLRHKGKTKEPADARGTFTSGLSIHDRPKEVKNRQVIGHWEADGVLLPRKKGKACVATLVEGKRAFKMPD